MIGFEDEDAVPDEMINYRWPSSWQHDGTTALKNSKEWRLKGIESGVGHAHSKKKDILRLNPDKIQLRAARALKLLKSRCRSEPDETCNLKLWTKLAWSWCSCMLVHFVIFIESRKRLNSRSRRLTGEIQPMHQQAVVVHAAGYKQARYELYSSRSKFL
jgi:hypothetical protein